MEPNTRTDFLISKTDFLTGMGSVASTQGSYFEYNYSENGALADKRAIESDWKMVGKDILSAITKFRRELSVNA